ncbi:hypothetical protein BTA51_02030 [Hahella sp. CCB-MM4]|uniref:efflux RND transporter periplasmic adaptor subunit n=1 Tax=Hahella sp. (strain CCB-MM4) TaxID=1926491 RepID=UPI000B9C5A0C|nr:hypothetical protein [Hahella sp. CCB-MM4]OZG75187.1 hypothetical protein BTA51_02030 [Hahella sp. CCB-MM4]
MNNSHLPSSLLTKRWLLPVVIALGIATAVAIVKSRPPMVHQEPDDSGVKVGVIPVRTYEVKPEVVGYGEVAPDVLLDLRAEVSGKVTYVHPQLRKGAVLPSGTLVLTIDAKDYQLALKQAEATLAQSQANLDELTLALEDARINLNLAREKMEISEKELQRNAALLKKGSISKSTYDSQRTALIQQQQEVQNLENQVKTLPVNIRVQDAQIQKSQAEVETQLRNLDRTNITLPFTARITALNTEENQYVSLGSSLFSAQTIDRVKVNAQFALDDFRLLANSFGEISIQEDSITWNGLPQSQSLFDQLALTASVRLVGVEDNIWPGKVEQISNNLDPSSRTIGATVAVADPYKNIKPGVKPPLVEGMYTEVHLRGKPVPYQVVPRSAVHEGQVYVVTSDNQLQRISLKGYVQGDMLLLENALAPELKVVTTDLFPAIDGMKLSPYDDTKTEQMIQQWVQ